MLFFFFLFFSVAQLIAAYCQLTPFFPPFKQTRFEYVFIIRFLLVLFNVYFLIASKTLIYQRLSRFFLSKKESDFN